ncbi:hypothetical protein [Cognatilysobacter bugurensis]|uniref:RNA polymerase sigma factor 70 region 4 type 2 domain-containing protein n=1 Tax=Cognatilysobacter bugurensis TaxID=543356 RepID=A0A918T0W0_9GAMM|nr:hypothetical protein [Lysobacter bugurensis]GHA82492.1 hypothetical protein GCM10007067_20580 [Lysobacter bugurensis]
MSVAPARVARTGPSSALTAFVHGVERRARVLAELQAGDADAGNQVLAEATRVFALDAADRPLAQWPQSFWSALLAATPMREQATHSSGWHALAPGPRAALLLRWAGGLDDATAAQALGVSANTFRLALRHALDAAGDNAPALHAEVDTRLAAPEPARQHAPETRAEEAAEPAPERPRRLLAVLWTLLAGCVVAFAATFFPQKTDDRGAHFTPLPESAPAARYDAADGLIVHRDFALLVDANAAPWLDDLEFYAWLAAGAPGPTAVPELESTAPALAPVMPEAALETFDGL